MKYIRTKYGKIIDLNRIVDGDKVFHLNENEIENGSWSGWYWYNEEDGYELECRDLDILKQADTIEELCDEFVFHVENQGHWVINNYKRALEIAKSYNEDEIKFICCGAIRTNKGLIYVAKMNRKGELELL